MTSAAQRREALVYLLQNNDTSKYFIEWGGYRSNHVAHGLVALHRLGGDGGRMEKYIEWYQGRMEPPDGETAKLKVCPKEEQDGFPTPGSHHSYYRRLKYYKEALTATHSGDLAQLIESEFPKLSLGLAGSALHGLIQLGYGFACESTETVCEGLANLHYSFLPIKVHFGVDMGSLWTGTRDILDVLEEIRQDRALTQCVRGHAELNIQDVKALGPFSSRMTLLLSTKAGDLFNYARRIKLPKYKDFASLYKWLLDCTLQVYVKSESANGFFLLHGVTGAWSLLQVLPALKETSDVIGSFVSFVVTHLAVYITEECPALNQSPSADLFKYKEWTEIKKAALAGQYDTHVYKLVQGVHDLATDGADAELDLLYRSAANIALNNDFCTPGR